MRINYFLVVSIVFATILNSSTILANGGGDGSSDGNGDSCSEQKVNTEIEETIKERIVNGDFSIAVCEDGECLYFGGSNPGTVSSKGEVTHFSDNTVSTIDK